MHLRAVCSECGEPLTAANVTPRLGAPLKELAKSTQAMKLAQLED
jgi:hypothetical protein